MYAYLIEAARMMANIESAISSKDITLTSLIFDNAVAISRNVTNSALNIYGGTADEDESARLDLFGRNESVAQGGRANFMLCYDPTYGNNPYFSIYNHNVIASSYTLLWKINILGQVITSGIYDDTVAGTANVIVSVGGHLQRATSNEKGKKDIKDLSMDTSKVLLLRPREFKWTHEIRELREEAIRGKVKIIKPAKIIIKSHVGLIAEEVEKIMPEFATHNIGTGEPDGISWNTIITGLVSEVRKLRDEVNELKNNC